MLSSELQVTSIMAGNTHHCFSSIVRENIVSHIHRNSGTSEWVYGIETCKQASVWWRRSSCWGLMAMKLTPNRVSGLVVNTLRMGRGGEEEEEEGWWSEVNRREKSK
jgi:hypothetical protein